MNSEQPRTPLLFGLYPILPSSPCRWLWRENCCWPALKGGPSACEGFLQSANLMFRNGTLLKHTVV